MRVVIAGTRNYSDYEMAKRHINDCLVMGEDTVIVSGGCNGADKLGERYAEEHDLLIERHPANWQKYGKRAGIVRNKEMAETADLVICFWDGKSKGTKHMIECAKRLNKTVKVIMIT